MKKKKTPLRWVLIMRRSVRPLNLRVKGFILGVGAKMFTIAGPVIVYGTVASVVYGVVLWGITTIA